MRLYSVAKSVSGQPPYGLPLLPYNEAENRKSESGGRKGVKGDIATSQDG